MGTQIGDLRLQKDNSVDGKRFYVLEDAEHMNVFIYRITSCGTECPSEATQNEKNVLGRIRGYQSRRFLQILQRVGDPRYHEKSHG